jgi:hypothetical protein
VDTFRDRPGEKMPEQWLGYAYNEGPDGLTEAGEGTAPGNGMVGTVQFAWMVYVGIIKFWWSHWPSISRENAQKGRYCQVA